MPLSAGDEIAGKYRIERPLGEGGMGRVYVATHPVLRKKVALKVMVARFRVDPDAVERFFREAVAASKVDHPAIVQVFDAGVHDGSPFMVMELLEGEDLDQRLERVGRLSVEETLRIARPVLSALEAAHRAGIVHRDIKPPNIFLRERANGVVLPKLLDFGIAKHVNDPTFDRMTKSGSVLGTPLYLSPEQARADVEVDHRADIYSMGVTLFHCLCGTTPYEASSFAELVGKMFSQPPRDLAELAPDVPRPICAAIQRCLSRDPKLRPQSARELLDRLNDAASAAARDASPAAFAKTELPAHPSPPSPTTEIVIAEPVPTMEVEAKTTAFERPKTPPASPAPAPPRRQREVKAMPRTRLAAAAGEPAPAPPAQATEPEAVRAASTARSASAWSVAGMESGVDHAGTTAGAPRGGAPIVLATLLLTTLAVGAAWLFAGNGRAVIAGLVGEGEPSAVTDAAAAADVDADAAAGEQAPPSAAAPDDAPLPSAADPGGGAAVVAAAPEAMVPNEAEAPPEANEGFDELAEALREGFARRAAERDPAPAPGGGASPRDVRAILRADPGLRDCQRRHGPERAGFIYFEVASTGVVANVRGRPRPGADGAPLACYERRLRRIRFPRRERGRYSLVFPP